MAYATGVYWVTLILFITRLLMKAEIDVCRRGVITVSPAQTVPLGATVNVSCFLKATQGCSRPSGFQKLTFYQNRIRLSSQKSPVLSVLVSDLQLGTTVFVCKLSCGGGRESQVCGADVSVGVTPEQPQNLSCSQLGEQGHVICTWDKGRDTHLYTVYTLQLTGPNDFNLEKRRAPDLEELDLGISLNPASPEAIYTARVVAENSLGNSSSLPLVFTFMDIVKPLPPSDIRADFPKLLANFCTLQWEDEGSVVLNRLQFRPVHERAWETVHVTDAGGRYDLYNLRPFTEYEFQISSKLHSVKGRWSDWSKVLRTRTPEEEPVGPLDVWYTVEDLEGDLQSISLFWKNLSVSEAKGAVLGYQVTVREVSRNGSAGPPALEAFTQHTHYSVLAPPKDHAVAVSARNSKGGTPPTWTFVSRQRRREHVKPHLCYQIRLCALWGTGVGCAHTWANLSSREPLSGPLIHSATAGRGAATLTWAEIPARDQRGCLLRYSIYLREAGSASAPRILEIPYEVANTSVVIRDLSPGVTYVLWMTASTAAGEGPPGNERELFLEGALHWHILVVLTAAVLFTVGIFSVPRARAKVKSVISALQPQWYNQEIPDPANSMWAKKHCLVEEEMQLHLDSFSNNWTSSEEPETLEIKEVLQKAAPTLWETEPSCWPKTHNLHELGRKTSPRAPKPIENGIEYGVSHPPEKGQVVDLYKAMGFGGTKAEDPAVQLRDIPVDYLPANMDYLPSNLDYLPSIAADPLEESELHGLSFSVFPKGSLPPLICGEKLTLDRVKIDSGSITH
ncbi:interleukin-12 receptor subunit beta-2 isoform X2 [Sminthopsis crassicaudata]|uniref:interleukin-12 receptor subunit beta-2 isoform X2 n=1 Tax=Sminthopsis crassicaudata TaxID=9301 RepID=UPI003D6905EC